MLIAFTILAALLAVPLCILTGVTGIALCAVYIGFFVACFVAVLFLYVLVLFVFSLCIDKNKPRTKDRPFVRFLIAETLRIVFFFGRVKIDFEGKEKLPEGKFLLVSNHRSMFDPLVALVALRDRPLAFVTKPENLKIPLVGNIIRYACFLPIDRESPRNAIRTINAAAALIKEDTISMGIYPEGTRNKGAEGALLPFHAGVFMIAQKANAPVVIAVTHGTASVAKNFPFRRSKVSLKICSVISADEAQAVRAPELSERVRETMENELNNKK